MEDEKNRDDLPRFSFYMGEPLEVPKSDINYFLPLMHQESQYL